MERRHKLWIDGRWQEADHLNDVRSPYSGQIVARVDQASNNQITQAVNASVEAAKVFRTVSRHMRSALLREMARLVSLRRADFVQVIVDEAGKPAQLADLEVTRCLTTLTVAADEAKRYGGDVIPLDIDAGARAYAPAISVWVPRGPVLGITPFNFPLNLVAHKVAPALAVGAPILIKPAPQAPGAAALLAEVFEQAVAGVADTREKIPLAAFQVFSASNEVVAKAITDKHVPTVSFTGSTASGHRIQAMAVGKRVLLELGGNAAVIVHQDADLDRAANRIASGAFSYAGQSCISVQRVFVHKEVLHKFQDRLLAETGKIISGDPAKREVLNGPLIDEHALTRVMEWIEEAKADGARVIVGGKRQGTIIEPTIITGAKANHKLICEEAFAPVVVISSYDQFSQAIDAVNDSRFGLQAGVFTDSSKLIYQAIQNLDVGGVMINEIPTYRADQMPYGGVKDSGLGREGLRYAMEEYSERRTVVQWVG